MEEKELAKKLGIPEAEQAAFYARWTRERSEVVALAKIRDEALRVLQENELELEKRYRKATAYYAAAQRTRRRPSRKELEKLMEMLRKCGKLIREINDTAKEYPEFEVDSHRYELIASHVKANLRMLKEIKQDLSRAERRGRRGRRRR